MVRAASDTLAFPVIRAEARPSRIMSPKVPASRARDSRELLRPAGANPGAVSVPPAADISPRRAGDCIVRKREPAPCRLAATRP